MAALNIYYARESVNKDRFIFDNVGANTILIVPDQYSLEAEKDAFYYLQKEGLLDIEILSFSRLSDRVIGETGGRRLPMIDKQGRHMLLTKIMADREADLEIFGRYKRNPEFLDMTNNMISELKQSGISAGELKDLEAGMQGMSLLKSKLHEISDIYSKYEEAIADHYIDTEDLARLFCGNISHSRAVKENTFWIYGFDVFSPANLSAIGELIKYAPSVNVAMTWDDQGRDAGLFEITGQTIDRLVQLGEDANVRANLRQIPQTYKRERPAALACLEKELYALPFGSCEGGGRDETSIRIAESKDINSEAETAALTINRLVRERGLRYRDIVVICNDMDVRAGIFKQVFARYGIKVFSDEKRSIAHSSAAAYVMALLDVISRGYKAVDIISMLKTGLTDAGRPDIEKLENYARKYKIKGAVWKKPFTKGAADIGTETLEEIEQIRKNVIEPVLDFHEKYKSERQVAGKVSVLYDFLTEMCIPERLRELTDRQETHGENEEAMQTAQVWNRMMGVFDQLVELLGDQTISADDFAEMLKAGIAAVEIGVLPPAADGLMMGTMQRTRVARARVMMIVGACEGVLPLNMKARGLLSEIEKESLMDMSGKRLLKTDELRAAEESVAIYRGMSKADEMLYVSYAATAPGGEQTRPSMIYDRVCRIFPNVVRSMDMVKAGQPIGLLGSVDSTVVHLAEYMSSDARGEDDERAFWGDIYAWYEKNVPDRMERIKDGFLDDNHAKLQNNRSAAELYMSGKSELMISPTRLEKFAGCPFAHFMMYGLRVREEREYGIGGLEMGDVLHRCLDTISRDLGYGIEGHAVTAFDSPWMHISEQECRRRVNELIDDIAVGYKDGLLHDSKAEEYRLSRIRDVCYESVRMMIAHVRHGRIDRMMSEVRFARNGELDPIKVETSAGDVYIEGIIDRMDILPDERAKVIDYKSGGDKWVESEVLSGWKLQLMLYLKAAGQNGYRPAGTYYFHLDEPMTEKKDAGTDIEKELRKVFRMDGISIDDPQVIAEIDADADGKTRGSEILPAKSLSEEEFAGLMGRVSERVSEMCNRIVEGDISIRPKRSLKSGSFSGDKKTACDHCPYHGICKFDTRFESCEYEYV